MNTFYLCNLFGEIAEMARTTKCEANIIGLIFLEMNFNKKEGRRPRSRNENNWEAVKAAHWEKMGL